MGQNFMNHDPLLGIRESFKQLADFSDDHLDTLTASLKTVTYRRNEYFSTPDKPSTMLAFVSRGLFKQYVIDLNGNEVIREFCGDNMFMSTYAAITLNIFQPIYVQAIENSIIAVIPRVTFLEIIENEQKWKDVLQELTELDCLHLYKREFSLLLDDAKTRYLNFLKDYHLFADRIKLKDVASYLGISPETLSRLRSLPLKKQENNN